MSFLPADEIADLRAAFAETFDTEATIRRALTDGDDFAQEVALAEKVYIVHGRLASEP